MKRFILLALCLAGALADCNWEETTEEWTCIPWGGTVSCTGEGSTACFSDSVPSSNAGCSLPTDRSDWLCCYDCSARGTDICQFSVGSPPGPVPSPPIDDGGLDNTIPNRPHGLNTLDIVLIAVAAVAVVASAGTAFFFWNRRRGYGPINQG